MWVVGPVGAWHPPPSTALPTLSEQRAKVKPGAEAHARGGLGPKGAPVTMATQGLLTEAAGGGGLMAPHTLGQKVGPPVWSGLWVGDACSPRSLRFLGAVFLMRKSFLEAGLFLRGFPSAGWGQAFHGHLWFLDLKLLWGR